jgi:hypothetical protein
VRVTIEISDVLHRSAKLRAKDRGVTLGQFLSEALDHKLQTCPPLKGKPWMKSFGGLKHMHEENVRIQQIIDEEFGRLD